MNALPVRIAPEIARRAADLPLCPCGCQPFRVSLANGTGYVQCAPCRARTHTSANAAAVDRQWRVLVACHE